LGFLKLYFNFVKDSLIFLLTAVMSSNDAEH